MFLVPELVVIDLDVSLRFWRDLVGFSVAYERPEEGFACLSRDGVSFMLEQYDKSARVWETAPLERPLGRGVNFEITRSSIEPVLSALRSANWPLFMEPETKLYRVDGEHHGVRQFLVQDPDGYLLRFAEPAGSGS